MLQRLVRNLTFQVLIAVSLGVLLGVFEPEFAKKLKPIGDTFVNLVKMVITPIIFLTIVHGIASMADLRRLGRVGGKALLYFELVSTLALAIGLVVVNLTKPGAGLDATVMVAPGAVSAPSIPHTVKRGPCACRQLAGVCVERGRSPALHGAGNTLSWMAGIWDTPSSAAPEFTSACL